MKVKQFLLKYYLEIIVVLLGLTFGTLLMFSTFSSKDGEIIISSKAWSDFASHIPLIRSFSFGHNFPPQYPIFPGEPIKYHFLFYALVGFLERVGLRIDLALNIPSVLGFASLVFSIYFFASKLFKSKAVGFISALFFLFNGSLAFLEFFKNHPLSINSFQDIITSTKFSSFAPYDSGIVSAFWNLNIFTNQRHLAFSISFLIIFIYLVLRPVIEGKKLNNNQIIILGIALGLFFFFHTAVIMMLVIVLAGLFLSFPNLRKNIFFIMLIGGIIVLPQYLYIQSGESVSKILYEPGYLISGNLNIPNFVNYWFNNLGLHVILIAIGLFFAPRPAKKIFLCFLTIFIIGNLFKFTPDMATNHKFFNVFMIIGTMYSAFALIILWKKVPAGKIIVPILIFFMTLSGIIDLFPIFNDNKYTINDYKKDKTIAWIMTNTKPDSIFLNSTYLYNPASIAGRKIVLGWPYFSWGAGYNSEPRDNIRKEMLNTNDLDRYCKLSKIINPDYVIINETLRDENSNFNLDFLSTNFNRKFEDQQTGFIIFQLKEKCN